MYKINEKQFELARKKGIEIKASKKADKKIDVFRNGQFITSIGAQGYEDYHSYLKNNGKTIADNKKRLFLLRHKNNNGEAGMFSKLLLW